MGNKTPPTRSNTLHTPNNVALLATSEATAVAAGDTILYPNRGNDILRVVVTTAGTGTINALIPANNQAITLAIGDNLIGPLDPAIFGENVTITTATAIGSCALYVVANRFANGLHNPFETNPLNPDA